MAKPRPFLRRDVLHVHVADTVKIKAQTLRRQPLYATVAEMAKSAASRDSRFPPVSVEELEYIDIEISVLSLLKTIVDIREIVVGDHGLLIRRMSYQGLLLPQVAIENSWNRETFLINTCRKAGLPDDAWKDDSTTIQIFTAEVFCDFDI